MSNKKIIHIFFLIFIPYFGKASNEFDQLYQQMQYLAKRDVVLSQNIQNADTPMYKPKEVYRSTNLNYLAITKTHPFHIALDESDVGHIVENTDIEQIKPNGNAVSLESELFKKSENALKLNEVMASYSKAKSMLNTAIVGLK